MKTKLKKKFCETAAMTAILAEKKLEKIIAQAAIFNLNGVYMCQRKIALIVAICLFNFKKI